MPISLVLLCLKMFQVEDARPYAEQIDGRDLIVPIEKYGIKVAFYRFSFVDPGSSYFMAWRMASNALKQLIEMPHGENWIISYWIRLRAPVIFI